MIGIDTFQVIAKECPKYPEPAAIRRRPERRKEELDAFQEEAKTRAIWLTVDALRAALRYIEWLEDNTDAADNEKYGICASVDDDAISYQPADIVAMLEAREIIRKAIRQIQDSKQ